MLKGNGTGVCSRLPRFHIAKSVLAPSLLPAESAEIRVAFFVQPRSR